MSSRSSSGLSESRTGASTSGRDVAAVASELKHEPEEESSVDPQLLLHAASKGKDDVIKWLLREGVNVDVRDDNGNTALLIASEEGHTSSMRLLLENGANLSILNYAGFSCAHEAARKGSSDLLKVLLEEDGDEGFWGGKSLAPGSLSKDPSRYSNRLQLMEMKSVDEKYTPLHLAARNHHIKTLVQLLKAYIILALKLRGFNRHPRPSGMDQFLELIRDSNCDQSSFIARKLEGALPAKEDHYLAIRDKLLNYCMSKADHKEWKEAFVASRVGQYSKVAEEFVDAYTSFLRYSNERDSATTQRTFLHYIADNPSSGFCENLDSCSIRNLLRFVTIDVNALDAENETPVHLIAKHGHLCMLSHIFETERTPDLLARNTSGDSPGKILWNKCRKHIFNSGLEEFNDTECDGAAISGENLCRDCATLTFLEKEVFEKFSEEKYPDFKDAVAEFLLHLREVLEERRIPETEAKLHRKQFHEDGHANGLTRLHYLAYRKHVLPMQELVRDKKFRRLINRQYDWNGQTALHFAVLGRRIEVVEGLLLSSAVLRNVDDARSRTPCELLSEIVSSDYSSTMKDTEALMLKDEDVKSFMEKQYHDRQVHVDAGNTALVGAALIASVTFAGWLQPPLGYTAYSQYNQEQYAAVEDHASVQLFWLFNSLSFFSAIATVVSGSRAMLPAPHSQFIAKEVRHLRRWLVLTSFFMVVSIVCVLGAFTAAGFGTLPPNSKYQTLMTVTSIIGGVVCVVVLYVYFLRLIAIFSRDSSRFWSMVAERKKMQGPKRKHIT
ncbi:hypothetical protein R1flu_007042 [Riccia fluitans]|uniref:PGG domain-containing protein n=1 Tax=Riccia fluitans TaxID=41844 RepID=A0ABD1YXY3_9MARC